MDDSGYSGTQAAKIVGITYRQLDYWARTDLIRPSLAEATGSGSRRRYSYRDLLELRVIKTLLDAGIRLESVREVFTYLRQHVTSDIAAAHIVISGNQVMLCDGDQLVDVLRARPGRAQRAARCRASRTTSTPSSSRSRTSRRRPRRGGRSDHGGGGGGALAARRGAPRPRRPDGAVRRLGDAARVRRPARSPSTSPAASDAVVFDVSHLGTVQVTGAGALATLQEALTNDLGKVAPGRAQYTHLLDDADGSVLDDIIVWWHPGDGDEAPDVFDVMPNASNTDRVRDAVGGRETTHERAVLAVQGPQALDRLADGVPRRRRRRALPRRPRRRGTARRAPSPAPATRASAASRSPCRPPPPPTCGRRSSAPASRRPGSGARDTLRLEAGLPLHGHELGPGITPLQAGLGWVVAWGKPAFRGREALEAERDAGVTRHLVGIATEGRRPPRAECAVLLDGEAVGTVTSGNFSPVLGHGIALAFVPPSVGPGHAGRHRRPRHGAPGHGRRRPRSSPSTERCGAGPSVWRIRAWAGSVPGRDVPAGTIRRPDGGSCRRVGGLAACAARRASRGRLRGRRPLGRRSLGRRPLDGGPAPRGRGARRCHGRRCGLRRRTSHRRSRGSAGRTGRRPARRSGPAATSAGRRRS